MHSRRNVPLNHRHLRLIPRLPHSEFPLRDLHLLEFLFGIPVERLPTLSNSASTHFHLTCTQGDLRHSSDVSLMVNVIGATNLQGATAAYCIVTVVSRSKWMRSCHLDMCVREHCPRPPIFSLPPLLIATLGKRARRRVFTRARLVVPLRMQ